MRTSKITVSDTRWLVPTQLKSAPPRPNARKSPAGMGEVVVTVAVVVAVDEEAEHGAVQGWADTQILNGFEGGAGLIPGLVAVRVYPSPGWLMDRSENEATPPLALTVKVPDSDAEPGFGFDPRATVTAALEPVASWPAPSRTSTLTGPPGEGKPEVITALAAA